MNKTEPNHACCGPEETGRGKRPLGPLLPLYREEPAQEVCCGPPAGPASSPFEKPGYRLCRFVAGFEQTPAGPVPTVKDRLERQDIVGALKARLGIGRNRYKIAPGLYAAGSPGPEAPVLVTANYKLTFDTVRKAIQGMHAWILVLDTRGINVWCAAGKKTFSTAEVVRQVERSGLARLVTHKKLILPQLSATGVSAAQVKKGCGFEVIWGPVRAADIRAFVDSGFKADPGMRRVTFTLWERLVLIPVELTLLQKYLIWLVPAVFILSGVGEDLFSLNRAWHRGLMALAALLAGVLSGTVAVPLLLPWLPGRAFSVKGSLVGMILGGLTAALFLPGVNRLDAAAMVLLSTVLSSYLAMNFTGSTPFTSPSGVEKEMRMAIPGQALGCLISVGMWVGATFA